MDFVEGQLLVGAATEIAVGSVLATLECCDLCRGATSTSSSVLFSETRNDNSWLLQNVGFALNSLGLLIKCAYQPGVTFPCVRELQLLLRELGPLHLDR